jgi:Flp pilus assembly protein TadD
LYQQGRLEEAISTFEKALKVSPTDAETHYLLGAAQLQLGKMNEAEQSLLKALEIDQNLPEARFGLAMLRKVQGRNEEAIAEFEAFLAGPPAQDPQAKAQAELMLKELRGQ